MNGPIWEWTAAETLTIWFTAIGLLGVVFYFVGIGDDKAESFAVGLIIAAFLTLAAGGAIGLAEHIRWAS